MIILKSALALIVFLLPLAIGFLFKRKSYFESYLFGQILLWAVFEVIAVPMVRLRVTFNTLWIAYIIVVLVLAGWGIKIKIGTGWRSAVHFDKDITHYIPYILAFFIIFYQMTIYFIGMHLDEDDARWIAEANDALVKNRMYLHNPATGEYIGRFVGEMQKDIFSPWGMYIAVLSKLTTIRAAGIAHTIYPPILIGLSYIIYDLIGRNLFKGRTERGLFILMVSMINMFMAGNAYTQSVFTLTRIWQGKAVVAAVLIPLYLLLLLKVQTEKTKENWFWFIIAVAAGCLFSGIGIAISVIMITVYGLYALICMVVRKKAKQLSQT